MIKKALGLVVGTGVMMAIGITASAAVPPTTAATTLEFNAVVQPQVYAIASQDSPNIITLAGGTNFGWTRWNAANTAVPNWFKVGYANIPFSITVTGDNEAGDGAPIFARQELNGTQGNSNYDRLNSHYFMNANVNGINATTQTLRYEAGSLELQGQTTAPIGAPAVFYKNPNWKTGVTTFSFANAPHDGEVWFILDAYVNTVMYGNKTPVAETSPDSTIDRGWNESPDAGVYKAWLTLSLQANTDALTAYRTELATRP